MEASRRRKRRSLTRPDKATAPIPDLVRRDFTAHKVNLRWCGDLTEIPTDDGKLYLATVLDLGSRRLPGFAISDHHDSAVPRAALCMAAQGTISAVSESRPLLTASDLDAMSPDERAAAVAERVVTELDALPPAFRERVVETGTRLAAERRALGA